MITLDKYHENDQEIMIDWIIDFFDSHALHLNQAPDTTNKDALKSIENWTNKKHEVFIIQHEVYGACGFIHIYYKGDTVFWLEDIYVDSKYRRQGIAKKAMLKVETLLKDTRKCQALCLDVIPRNKDAIHLYHSLGYDSVSLITLRKAINQDTKRDKELELFDLTFKY